MKQASRLALLAAAVLLVSACHTGEVRNEAQEESPKVKVLPTEIGKGTFRIRQVTGGPYVAWAHVHEDTVNPYEELWIMHTAHQQPGVLNSVAWIFDKVTDATDVGIMGSAANFSAWIQQFGRGKVGGAVPKEELTTFYCTSVQVGPVP